MDDPQIIGLAEKIITRRSQTEIPEIQGEIATQPTDRPGYADGDVFFLEVQRHELGKSAYPKLRQSNNM